MSGCLTADGQQRSGSPCTPNPHDCSLQLLAHKNQETWQTRQHQQGNALQQRPSAALPQASASRAASVPRPAAGAAAELDSPRGSTQQSDLGDSGLAVPMLESGLSPTPILQGPSVYRWASSEPGVKDEELRSLDSLPPGSSVDGQGFGGHATMQVSCARNSCCGLKSNQQRYRQPWGREGE